MIEKSFRVILFLLLISAALISSSHAKIGYDVSASVNSSSWSVDRSTQNLDFSMAGSVSGFGSFTKLTHIRRSAGIESDELSSASPGYLDYEELMRLQSREGPVLVTSKIKSGVNESINESVNVTAEDYVKIDVDERWPARFANYKKISYLGPGIRTRESYQNNGDIVATSIDSWKLTKESVYEAQINRSVTSVNITSDDVVELTSENKSSRYGLDLETIGSLAHLDMIRLDDSGDPKLRITQDYLGEEYMNLNITMGDYVPPPEEPREWLDCCYGEEADREADKALECSSAAL